MKRIAILVIGAVHRPLYEHYVRNYWSSLIAHTNANIDHIDVFLLFENDTDISEYQYLWENIILDPNPNSIRLSEKKFRSKQIPGIMSKTVHAIRIITRSIRCFF